MGESLMKVQESVQMYCVKEEMRDGDGKNFKMGFEDWDIIGQGTASLTTITAVVKKAEGDKYVNKHPELNLKERNWNDKHNHSPGHTHTYHCVTDTHLSLSLTPTSI
jgi:hypothetical protein